MSNIELIAERKKERDRKKLDAILKSYAQCATAFSDKILFFFFCQSICHFSMLKFRNERDIKKKYERRKSRGKTSLGN